MARASGFVDIDAALRFDSDDDDDFADIVRAADASMSRRLESTNSLPEAAGAQAEADAECAAEHFDLDASGDGGCALRKRSVVSSTGETCLEDDGFSDDDGEDDDCERDLDELRGDDDELAGTDAEEESLGVLVAMALLVVALLASVGYVAYHTIASEHDIASHLPARRATESKHVHVQVDLAQLYSGDRIQLGFERRVACEHCAGSGMDFRAGVHACHKCDGTGVQTSVQQIGPIKQHVRSVCKVCGGRGQVAKSKCSVCHGRGLRDEKRRVAVELERGMRHGDQIVLAGEGDQAPRTLPGDLVVHLHAKPHSTFTRRGDDLELQLKITLLEALVGFTREVAHLDRRVLRLARDVVSAPDTLWRIPREGMPVRGKPGRAGDLIVRFAVAFPSANETLDASTKAAIAQLLAD